MAAEGRQSVLKSYEARILQSPLPRIPIEMKMFNTLAEAHHRIFLLNSSIGINI